MILRKKVTKCVADLDFQAHIRFVQKKCNINLKIQVCEKNRRQRKSEFAFWRPLERVRRPLRGQNASARRDLFNGIFSRTVEAYQRSRVQGLRLQVDEFQGQRPEKVAPLGFTTLECRFRQGLRRGDALFGSRVSNFGLPDRDLGFHDFLANVILLQIYSKICLRNAKQYKKKLNLVFRSCHV